MSKMNITNADEIYIGPAYHEAAYAANGRKGIPVNFVTRIDLGTPNVLDADGYAQSQTPLGAGNLTLNGALAGEADVARNVTITSAGDDHTKTFTVYGTDHYGVSVIEAITGANAGVAAGKKAFKTVTRIAVSAATADAVTAGTGDVLGLPIRIASADRILSAAFDGTVEAIAAFVAAVDTTATATTGDVRGTVDMTSALNNKAVIVNVIADASTGAAAYGVTQYAG